MLFLFWLIVLDNDKFCLIFQSSNPLDFKFYLVKLNNKTPVWCNVNFKFVFTAINNTKIKENRPYGEKCYYM